VSPAPLRLPALPGVSTLTTGFERRLVHRVTANGEERTAVAPSLPVAVAVTCR